MIQGSNRRLLTGLATLRLTERFLAAPIEGREENAAGLGRGFLECSCGDELRRHLLGCCFHAPRRVLTSPYSGAPCGWPSFFGIRDLRWGPARARKFWGDPSHVGGQFRTSLRRIMKLELLAHGCRAEGEPLVVEQFEQLQTRGKNSPGSVIAEWPSGEPDCARSAATSRRRAGSDSGSPWRYRTHARWGRTSRAFVHDQEVKL